ncbi:protein kinase domain-containing protein [Nocardia sp. NBC_00511]|uniref:serine/threonine protein kinase n=1 Tax=Nocardia sp. NBC_00511 TaxID=2903591 RepID=UPI0030E00720
MSVADLTGADIARVRAALPGYEVGGQIGRGGCGVVLAGVHRGLRRRVAIKQIPPQFAHDAQVRRRFVDEARVMAGLDHPHVVPVYDFVEHEDLCLLVLEYLPGGTVENRFVTAGFEATAAVAVALSCAAGLEAAHRGGILHRDVKPSNLLFAANGTLKLADFGIAKIVGGDETLVTRAGEIIGTPSYIAPEQVRGHQLSPATDVYALATMLYQLLSGVLPFPPGSDALSLLFAHAYGDPVPLGKVAPFIPQPIAEAVMRGLAPDPAERFDTAETFGVALAEPAAHCWGVNWLTPVGIPVIGADTIVAAATGSARGPRTPAPYGPSPAPYTPPPGNPVAGPMTPGPRWTGTDSSPSRPRPAPYARTEDGRGPRTPPPGAPTRTSMGQPFGSRQIPNTAEPKQLPNRGEETERGTEAGQRAGHAPSAMPRRGDPAAPQVGSGAGRAMYPQMPRPGPQARMRPQEPVRHSGIRLADVDRSELLPVQRVITLPSPRVPFLAAAVLIVLLGALAVLGVGSPSRDMPPAGMIQIGGVDPAVGTVGLDLSKPIPVTVSGGDADAAKLSVNLLGIQAGGTSTPLSGGTAELAAPVNQYVLAGHLTGAVTLSHNGSDTATYRFGVRTTQRSTTTATAVATLLLVLFAAAYAESNARTLRHGSARFSATVGLAISTGLLGVAAVAVAWVLLGREPTLLSVIACAAVGAVTGLALATGCRRVGKRFRYLRVQLLRERA